MPRYNAIMLVLLTIDKAGRIILPKPLPEELRLQAGDTLEVECSGEEITLRPSRGHAQLRKKHGVWVYKAGEPLSDAVVRKTVRQVRDEREAQNLGKPS
jgi:AbrB family looped-hinge helix DNA binding protein